MSSGDNHKYGKDEHITMECIWSGDSEDVNPFSILWFHNGTLLNDLIPKGDSSTSADRRIIINGREMIIMAADRQDAGNYTCVPQEWKDNAQCQHYHLIILCE